MIHVSEITPAEFEVTIEEKGSTTTHKVSLPQGYAEKLTSGQVETYLLVEESFAFLLEREPKESILRTFDLPVIGRYFPEYESEIRDRLGVV